MADGEEERKSSEESVKLFVGQVPKHMTEADLLAMFKEFALVEKVNVIKDKATRASRGCCFVICPSREEADKAVNACHNKKMLPLASSPLQVKYADGELERLGVIFSHYLVNSENIHVSEFLCYAFFCPLNIHYSTCTLISNFWLSLNPEHKLFIGMLPKNVSEVEVSALFSEYGTIKDLQILRGSQQTSKGCAFLKYETKEQALAALEAINGKHKMEGSSVPLVVKWADTEKERLARRAQKAQSQASCVPFTDVHPSLFEALPMGYVPPYNGYGYQAPGVYGLVPYRLPPMQNQPGFHSVMPHTNQGNALRPELGPNLNPRNYPVPHASYVGSYTAVPGVQNPMAYPGGMISPSLLNSSPDYVSPTAGNSYSATSSGTSKTLWSQVEGPPGANLFICHIPQEFGDEELATAFEPYGRLVSAKVFVDKATGESKCFGFVSYDSAESAQAAISKMNGCQLGGKNLKVQLKRDKQRKPF